MTVGSVLVDFDGTACPVDIAGEVCAQFAADGWQAHDQAVRRQKTTPRAAIDHQTAMRGRSA
jgi:2-hydroxy-3-keto-5-methylthiopentenyl-1-phosphate phosphatase